MDDEDKRPMQGFILGMICGLIIWSAAGLAYIYYSQPVHIDASGDRYSWMCRTDTECDDEAAARGLPIDRD